MMEGHLRWGLDGEGAAGWVSSARRRPVTARTSPRDRSRRYITMHQDDGGGPEVPPVRRIFAPIGHTAGPCTLVP